MKLWLLRPTEIGAKELGYDCSYGFVIRAGSAARARKRAANYRSFSSRHKAFWADPKLSSCLGLKSDGNEEVVMHDFHAG